MPRIRKALLGLGIICASLSTSCVSYRSLARDSLNYNMAVEKSQNQMLLLNIVRASKKHPLYLTSISKITGSNSASFSLEASIPFSTKGEATPGGTFEVNPTFDVPVLDSQEFMTGFLSPVKPEILAYYWNQGWPKEMLLHLLVNKIRLRVTDKGNKGKGGPATDYYLFNRPYVHNGELCQLEKFSRWVDLSVSTGKLAIERVEERRRIGPAVPDAEIELGDLIDLGKETTLELDALDANGKKLTRQQLEDGASPQAFQMHRSEGSFVITIDPTEINNIFDWTEASAANPCDPQEAEKADVSGRKQANEETGQLKTGTLNMGDLQSAEITLFLRSPEAMLYYLGQLLRVEERHELIPRLCIGGELEPLFVAQPSAPKCDSRSKIQVEYEGVSYTVQGGLSESKASPTCAAAAARTPWAQLQATPLRQKGFDCNPGRSMHSLSLLTQLISLQKSAKELPVTSTVRTVGD